MANNRITRDAETRESKERVKSWRSANLLPTPENVPDGVELKYVSIGLGGKEQDNNFRRRRAEGWEVADGSMFPELGYGDGPIEVGGNLILCVNDKNVVKQRKDHYRERSLATYSSRGDEYRNKSNKNFTTFVDFDGRGEEN